MGPVAFEVHSKEVAFHTDGSYAGPMSNQVDFMIQDRSVCLRWCKVMVSLLLVSTGLALSLFRVAFIIIT